jgi:hypothetical protein
VKCVVPLAGPDLVHPQHGFRPLVLSGGQPLLRRALDMRAWRKSLAASDYVFVVREVDAIGDLVDWLDANWPGCRVVRLPALTEGALYSVLAGVAAYVGDDEPLIVDLADMLFAEGPADIPAALRPGAGMVIPVFASTESCYSYLRSENGHVVEAAEKRVISGDASAGVYIFRNRAIFLAAAAHSMAHRAALAWKNALFICPMANGVLAAGLEVLAPLVGDVEPTGKIFHTGKQGGP